MSLILDESFGAGIPDSFATARAQSGTLSVTFDATSQAVDLSNTAAAQSIWDITSVPLSTRGEMEVDLEFLADLSGTNNYRHAGLWVVAGLANVSAGYRFCHLTTNYEVSLWSGSTSWAGSGYGQSAGQDQAMPFTSVGDRRIFNLRWDLNQTAESPHGLVECRLDGVLLFVHAVTPGFTSLRPGVFVYQATVRVHSLRAWDAPTDPLTLIAFKGMPLSLGCLSMAPPETLNPGGVGYRGLTSTLGYLDIYFGGKGRIAGQVFNSPDLPVARRVALMEEATRMLIRETWSEAATGAYAFEYLNMDTHYTVLAYDHTGAYRAVIADRVKPELMP